MVAMNFASKLTQQSIKIYLRQRRKKFLKLIHLLKYKNNLVPRMPTYTGSEIALFYPESPYFRSTTFSEELYNELKMNISPVEFIQLERCLTEPPQFTTVRVNTKLITPEQAVEQVIAIHSNKLARKECDFPIVYIHPKLNDMIVIEPQTRLEKVFPRGKEIIVDLRCGQAVLRGAEVYCGGIMATPLDMKPGDQVAVFCDVEEKCLQGWSKPYDGKKVFVANGISHVQRRELFCDAPKTGLGIQIQENIFPTPALYAKFGSTLYLQNLPSVVCVHVLGPKPGETILDMCAAPGGKTTHIATMMNCKGRVIALDKSPQRVGKMKQNIMRLELESTIKTIPFNAVKCVDAANTFKALEDEVLLPPYKKETFDRVLVDAPCSALGNRPQLCRPMTMKELRNYPETQKILLSKAVQLVKVGGTLVYSTCSLSICENECVVDFILKKFAGIISLVEQTPHVGKTGWKGDHSLTDAQLSCLQRFVSYDDDKSVDVDTIGFFIAKFIKIASV